MKVMCQADESMRNARPLCYGVLMKSVGARAFESHCVDRVRFVVITTYNLIN